MLDEADARLERLAETLRLEIRASAAENREWFAHHLAQDRERNQAQVAETRSWTEPQLAEARSWAAQQLVETRSWVETQLAENRRYFQVLGESLLSKIELVAEGVVTVDRKLDRFREEVRGEFAGVDHRLLRLEARVSALEHRLK